MARKATPMIVPPPALELCAEGALSVEECGAFCGGLCRDEIEKAIRDGEIETFRRGRRVLIARREAARWLAGLLEASRAGQ